MTAAGRPVVEVWAAVPGWPAYQVSDLGRVRSTARILPDGRAAGGVLLRPTPDGKGYLWVTLRQADVRWRVTVHLLVKLAFTGPRRGRVVRHLNDDPTDNRLVNLRYGTRSQNERDKRRNAERKNRQERYGTGVIGKQAQRFPALDGYNGGDRS